MHFYKRVQDLQAYLSYQKGEGHTIGFAPTMGALHQGHMSLIEHANAGSDISVASIFVNPTQFNEVTDLDKYPRTLESDINLLHDNFLNILFAPTVNDIYPESGIVTPKFDFQDLDKVLEGAFRPGHFAGVAQVVHRLVDIVQPDQLYMGQKDYQQWTIIHHMLQQMGSNIKLIMVPTIREEDGLAMSSRNRRLTPDWRSKAPVIHELLVWAKSQILQKPISEIESYAMSQLKLSEFNPEYFSIVDGFSLMPIEDIRDHQKIVACTAAWAGDIRLIDNIILKNSLTDLPR